MTTRELTIGQHTLRLETGKLAKQAGGSVLAEDESTCVVWGMPRAVFERGLADRVVPLDGMAEAIGHALGSRSVASHR